MKINLPQPSGSALQHSENLRRKIAESIHKHNGAIPFDHYMQLALYEPGLGYYSAGAQKFGAAGDFVTAPEISPLFSCCLARQAMQLLDYLGGGSILEFGAGSGKMARDTLQELAQHDALPEYYYILEPSADLKQRQQQLLANAFPEYSSRIIWLEQLPEAFTGIVLANELIDAFPVKLFQLKDNQLNELSVTLHHEQFCWQPQRLTDESLLTSIEELKQQGLLAAEYQSELNVIQAGWIKSLSQMLTKGAIIIIDYGFPRHEYYHPQRSQGTLMCHYRHHAHYDPFWLPGLQDITAHVDFTAIAESAFAAGLHIAGYNTQGGFLLGCGLIELLKHYQHDDDAQQLRLSQQLNKLISPAEMGELFKVIALTRDVHIPLTGFSHQDLRGRL